MNEKLKKYHEKRDFLMTKEPKGKMKNSKKHIFVVQHHRASHDHYDFRLQWNGVLVSFAVPKGPSLDPKEKRLAVHVEDHPLEYADFEGLIPKGQYGGGTVMLWDKGIYEAEGNFGDGLKNGSLKFFLYGQRLVGKWALVKLKKEQDSWLLIKEKDEFSSEKFDISKLDTSIKSGRTMQEIEKSFSHNPFQKVSVQLCKMVNKLPDGEDFLFEIKYDGYRVVAFSENGKTKLFSRNHVDLTKKFDAVAKAITELASGRALVLDGEIVLANEFGLPSFQDLQNAVKSGRADQAIYMVFDLLALDGDDLRELPLLERKSRLEALLKNSPKNLQFCEHMIGNGKKFFQAVSKMNLEGVVGKRISSKYKGQRNDDWVKCKCYHRQEFVVAGFVKSDKRDLSALILGVYDGNQLVYVGRAGSGIDSKMEKILLKKFTSLIVEKSPFSSLQRQKNVFWLKPKIVVEIQFAELTKDNILRQASFKGLREDKNASEVVFENFDEKIKKNEEKLQKIYKKTQKSLKNDIEICGIVISNSSRKIFNKENICKIDVAKYYEKVSQKMLEFLSGRVLSVVRCHNSIENKFFKKHPTVEKEGIKKIYITNSSGKLEEYFCVKNVAGLIEQVQLGTIEFHACGSHIENFDKPDCMVFDLDPDEQLSLEKIRQGVRDLKIILDEISLQSFLKTSGGKGYHVVVPFVPSVSWEEFRNFAENVAKLMESKCPERYTSNIRKDSRNGKIFIDYLRNTKGATSVAPYSLRARAGAKVSMPIFWSELESITPDGVDMEDAIKRLEKDPWQNFSKVKQSLRKK